jgi:hypothetical protein
VEKRIAAAKPSPALISLSIYKLAAGKRSLSPNSSTACSYEAFSAQKIIFVAIGFFIGFNHSLTPMQPCVSPSFPPADFPALRFWFCYSQNSGVVWNA